MTDRVPETDAPATKRGPGRPKGLPKTGGRQRGTPNKRTKDAAELLAKMGCSPIMGMATIAMNKRNPVDLRAKMFAELAPYVFPKRRAVEVMNPALDDFTKILTDLDTREAARRIAFICDPQHDLRDVTPPRPLLPVTLDADSVDDGET